MQRVGKVKWELECELLAWTYAVRVILLLRVGNVNIDVPLKKRTDCYTFYFTSKAVMNQVVIIDVK